MTLAWLVPGKRLLFSQAGINRAALSSQHSPCPPPRASHLPIPDDLLSLSQAGQCGLLLPEAACCNSHGGGRLRWLCRQAGPLALPAEGKGCRQDHPPQQQQGGHGLLRQILPQLWLGLVQAAAAQQGLLWL